MSSDLKSFAESFSGKNWNPSEKKNKIRSDYLVTERVKELITGYYSSKSKNQGTLKALDIGCGTGELAMFIAKQGFDVIACDVLPEQIQKAKINLSETLKSSQKEKLNVEYHVGGFSHSEFLKERVEFDLITSLLVHVYLNDNDFKESFKFISKHLKKDGLGIFGSNYQPRFMMFSNNGSNLYSDDLRLMPELLNKKITFYDTLEVVDKLIKEDGNIWETSKMYNHAPDFILNSIIDAGLRIKKVLLPRPKVEEEKLEMMKGSDVIPPYIIVLYGH